MSFLRVEDMHIDLGEFSLKGVSLEFDRGEYLTVMGPTGAGKTILLECLIGFYRPSRGRVILDGRDITDDPPEKAAHRHRVPGLCAPAPQGRVRQHRIRTEKG